MSDQEFDTHDCALPIKECKTIEVVYFSDGSYKDRQLMTGLGTDGILYTFEVVPRKVIPYLLPLSDDSYHVKKSDDKLPEPKTRQRPSQTSLHPAAHEEQQVILKP